MISIEEINFYKSVIDNLDIVFDVGCQHDNIFDELKPGIELHLFDPMFSERLFEKIRYKKNITYNKYALGKDKGVVSFHPAYGSILLRNDEPKLDDHREIEVYVNTVDDYCQDKRIKKIDLLKIDTEGYDFEVIKGARSMLHTIKYIQFEHWSNSLTNEIVSFLSPYKITPLHSKPKNFIITL